MQLKLRHLHQYPDLKHCPTQVIYDEKKFAHSFQCPKDNFTPKKPKDLTKIYKYMRNSLISD